MPSPEAVHRVDGPPAARSEAVFALLDEVGGAPQGAGGRLYTGFSHEHHATTPQGLQALWSAVLQDQAQGLHAVLLADYEWGVALAEGSDDGPGAAPHAAAVGGLRVLMFRRLQRLPAPQADAWLAAQEQLALGDAATASGPAPAGSLDLQADTDDAAFDAAIGAIHEAIRRGETYQVNYTYRLQGRAWGHPLSLYRRLRARQPVGYAACIALPAQATQAAQSTQAATWVLSLSPELFVQHRGGQLQARPMKGTAPRHHQDPAADAARADWLRADPKNRAENLMIVDLLRNDLGRLAQPGTVRVPALFEVEPYATVWQMTSTVSARPRPGLDLPQLLRATFPCGSITGAPKHRTLQIIRALESSPRGLYCGAIGWLDAPAPGERLGEACLSVAIRTLTLGDTTDDGSRPLTLGVGAGIVLDSVAAEERAECRLKARFLTSLDPGLRLIETLRWTTTEGVALWPRHLARLRRSAAALGFAFDTDTLLASLHQYLRQQGLTHPAGGPQGVLLAPPAPQRLRLTLAHDGQVEWHHATLDPLPDGPLRLRWADARLPVRRPLAGHKTTDRQVYDAATAEAVALGAFDSLLLREDGVLLEGGRCNVFLRLDGRWCTPPLADGVLPGVMRSVVLDDPAWDAVERRLTQADVQRAEALMVCNALRGTRAARLH